MFKLQLLYIIIGLIVGFIIMHITAKPPDIIIKYPTLDNIQNTTYIDVNGKCYKYYAVKTECK